MSIRTSSFLFLLACSQNPIATTQDGMLLELQSISKRLAVLETTVCRPRLPDPVVERSLPERQRDHWERLEREIQEIRKATGQR